MKSSDYVYDLILSIDSNVEPAILTFGSLLFDFLNPTTLTFDFDRFRLEAKKYMLYSEKNICKTFEFLEKNNLIYYSERNNKYYASDFVINVLYKGMK